MKLEITNFRCYQGTHILNIKSGTVTLIKGASGAGKTTLLRAFEWCLFGKRVSNTADETTNKTSVSIEWNKEERNDKQFLSIRRVKGNNKFYIQYGESKLEGVSAQAFISKMFGSETLWRSVAYIRQRERCALLEISKRDVLTELGRIAFCAPESTISLLPDEIRTKIDAHAKSIDKKLPPAQRDLARIEGALSLWDLENLNKIILHDEEEKFLNLDLINIQKQIQKIKNEEQYNESIEKEALDKLNSSEQIDESKCMMLRTNAAELEKIATQILQRDRIKNELDQILNSIVEETIFEITDEEVKQKFPSGIPPEVISDPSMPTLYNILDKQIQSAKAFCDAKNELLSKFNIDYNRKLINEIKIEQELRLYVSELKNLNEPENQDEIINEIASLRESENKYKIWTSFEKEMGTSRSSIILNEDLEYLEIITHLAKNSVPSKNKKNIPTSNPFETFDNLRNQKEIEFDKIENAKLFWKNIKNASFSEILNDYNQENQYKQQKNEIEKQIHLFETEFNKVKGANEKYEELKIKLLQQNAAIDQQPLILKCPCCDKRVTFIGTELIETPTDTDRNNLLKSIKRDNLDVELKNLEKQKIKENEIKEKLNNLKNRQAEISPRQEIYTDVDECEKNKWVLSIDENSLIEKDEWVDRETMVNMSQCDIRYFSLSFEARQAQNEQTSIEKLKELNLKNEQMNEIKNKRKMLEQKISKLTSTLPNLSDVELTNLSNWLTKNHSILMIEMTGNTDPNSLIEKQNSDKNAMDEYKKICSQNRIWESLGKKYNASLRKVEMMNQSKQRAARLQAELDNFEKLDMSPHELNKQAKEMRNEAEILENKAASIRTTKSTLENCKIQRNKILNEKNQIISLLESDNIDLSERISKLILAQNGKQKKEERNKILTQLDDARKICTNIEVELEHCKELKRISEALETRLLLALVSELNASLEEICETLFPEGTSIFLTLTKPTADGEQIRTLFDVHKIEARNAAVANEELDITMADLSGGEGDRVSFALALALASLPMFESIPMLLLDECLGSLDFEVREACTETLKRFVFQRPSRSILVVDHGCEEGLFDDVRLIENKKIYRYVDGCCLTQDL